ncbi:STM3941 family protein [Actinomycetospora cinnamomea]|uniref:STM3941 family protein n=1 Tax=Actinomycetospora cinnamomea TaxID=663609 RepID=UPI0010583330|nr:STM3941 family protein [Actinomycetospora cinnamomea]
MSPAISREPDRIEVRAPRAAPMATLAMSVVGVAAGVWLLVSGGAGNVVLGVVLLAFFGVGAIRALLRLVKGRALLVATPDGVDDGGSVVAAGFLPWSEIGTIEVLPGRGGGMLVIGVRDPEAVLARTSPARARVGRAQAGRLGSPVVLPPTVLPVPAEELAADLERLRP